MKVIVQGFAEAKSYEAETAEDLKVSVVLGNFDVGYHIGS